MGCPAPQVPAMSQGEICQPASVKAARAVPCPLAPTSCHLDEADVSRLSALCGSGTLGTPGLAEKLPVPGSAPLPAIAAIPDSKGRAKHCWQPSCYCHNHL